uniref:DNA damage-regulated autophagy modulator protein 2 n=1 Tax=Rhabditophanes sp. KR3021 TaxID=114890 RepID=A0AC35U2G0_9BILA
MVKILRLGNLGAGHLPIFFGILFTINLGFTYCMAVYNGDTDPLLPYISSVGDARPESCIFSLFMNICGALCILIIYLRYMLVAQLNREHDMWLKSVNRISFSFGLVAGVAMLIVGNFQETADWTVHIFAAVLCFTSATIYMCVDAFITKYMHPTYNNKRIANYRMLIASISVISLLSAIILGFAASRRFHDTYPDRDIPRPWNNKYFTPGYTLHCWSAMFEWVLAVLIMIYIISFSRDFETIHVKLRVESLVSHLDDDCPEFITN